ncbi:hypothetical protein Q7P35_000672 [Cladosporium inversicolor]
MATPGRNTRSRSRQTTPQPLPAVDVRSSRAYGSRGRAQLNKQLAGEGITLAEGFTTARAGAAITTVLEEDDKDDEELHFQPAPSRQGTYVGTDAQYESPAHSQRYDSMPPPSPRRAAPRTTDDVPGSPWTLSVLLFAVPRYLWRNLWAVLLGAILLGTAAHIKLPENAAARRDEFFRGLKIAVGVPGYDQPPSHLERLWMFVRTKSFLKEELDNLPPPKDPMMQQLINVRLRGLISDLGDNITAVEGNHTALAERVSTIEEFLPRRMVVDVVNGNMVIGEDFWHALKDKLKGSNDLFESFVAANEDAATRLAESAADSQIQRALNDKRILGRDDLMEILNQNGKDLEKRMSAMIQSGTSEAINAAREIAAQVAREISENTPSDLRAQLSILVKSNMLQNTYDAMQSINWFSPKMGAIVVPRHSSPTAKHPYEETNRGWFASSLKRVAPPPVAALMPWEEAGDCWCAAKTENMGMLQLAVITERKIMPSKLIIEHIPVDAELDRRCAPKSWQLWAEMHDKEEAEELKDRIRRHHDHYYGCSDESSPPSESSICIAEGTYDRTLENWVQSIHMLFLTYHEEAKLEAGKFYFRVLSNYGSPQTCIYRVRLTAHDSQLRNNVWGDREKEGKGS